MDDAEKRRPPRGLDPPGGVTSKVAPALRGSPEASKAVDIVRDEQSQPMATPDVQLLSAVISPWWAAFSVLTGLLMACASALADLVQGDHADDVPPLAIALVVLLSTAAVFDMITHRLAYYRADIYVTYSLRVAEALELVALVAFIAGTVQQVVDRRMRTSHGVHASWDIQDMASDWSRRSAGMSYGVLALPLLKSASALYRHSAHACNHEPWARPFLSAAQRQVALVGGVAAIAAQAALAHVLLLAVGDSIVGEARGVASTLSASATVLAAVGSTSGLVPTVMAQQLAGALECLEPRDVLIGAGLPEPSSDALWVEHAWSPDDGAVLRVELAFGCARSRALGALAVKAIVAAFSAGAAALGVLLVTRGAVPELVASVQRIVRVAAHVDGEGMVTDVMQGGMAREPGSLEDAASRLVAAIRLLVKAVFRSGAVMRHVMQQARDLELEHDAGLREIYGFSSAADALAEVRTAGGSGRALSVIGEHEASRGKGPRHSGMWMRGSVTGSANEGSWAFTRRTKRDSGGAEGISAANAHELQHGASRDGTGPRTWRFGARKPSSKDPSMANSVTVLGRRRSIDTEQSGLPRGALGRRKSIDAEKSMPPRHSDWGKPPSGNELQVFFRGFGTRAWNALHAPEEVLTLAVCEMFWRLGLLEGRSPLLKPGAPEGPGKSSPIVPIAPFVVPMDRLRSFIAEVQARYLENPYHRWQHAVDVVHSVYIILRRARAFRKRYLQKRELFCMMVAALAHDMGHRGVTNGHLVKTRDILAVTYNDKSPQEMMHVSALFQLCESVPQANVFEGLPVGEYDHCRKFIIDLILDTDMASHFARVGELEALWNRISTQEKIADLLAGGLDKTLEPIQSMGSHAGETYTYMADDVRAIAMAILHAADLGSCLKPVPLHAMWSVQVIQEFFNEARLEKEIGMRPLPFMDPEQCYVPTSQMDFLSFVCLPLFRVMFSLLPELKDLQPAITTNYDFWAWLVKRDQERNGRHLANGTGDESGAQWERVGNVFMAGSFDTIVKALTDMGVPITESAQRINVDNKKMEFRAQMERN